MKQTRQEKMAKGKLWQVYPHTDPDTIYFEGTKTACMSWLKIAGFLPNYKRGIIRLGKVIWEAA